MNVGVGKEVGVEGSVGVLVGTGVGVDVCVSVGSLVDVNEGVGVVVEVGEGVFVGSSVSDWVTVGIAVTDTTKGVSSVPVAGGESAVVSDVLCSGIVVGDSVSVGIFASSEFVACGFSICCDDIVLSEVGEGTTVMKVVNAPSSSDWLIDSGVILTFSFVVESLKIDAVCAVRPMTKTHHAILAHKRSESWHLC